MRIIWNLEISGYNNKKNICYEYLEDIDLEEIARLIKEGFTSGILDREEVEE